VHGFGTETVGTDFGQGQHFNPPYPAHFYIHGKDRFGLQCLTKLDLLHILGLSNMDTRAPDTGRRPLAGSPWGASGATRPRGEK
jgi:hypothetical protein